MNLKENYYEKLETKNLVLSPWKLTFTRKMYENWATDKDVTKYVGWKPHKNLEETEQTIKNWIQEKNYSWCILEKQNQEPIGSISTCSRDDKNFKCEVGYCLAKSKWNKGFMTEALKRVIEFLFDEGYNKITARFVCENVGSERVMQKAGMTYLGKTPKDILATDNKFHDCGVYYILNPRQKK